jgi:hypothetical protein
MSAEYIVHKMQLCVQGAFNMGAATFDKQYKGLVDIYRRYNRATKSGTGASCAFMQVHAETIHPLAPACSVGALLVVPVRMLITARC